MSGGFTLAEVLVCLVILAILTSGIFMVLNTGRLVYNVDIGHLDLQQQARQAMDSMTRELREASGINIIAITGNDDQITFNTTDESGIVYYRDINDINSDNVTYQIIREYPADTTKILANDITSLKFTQNGRLLGIQLEAKKNVQQGELSFPFNSTVRLRNP